jgi:hypothetical protein
MPGKTEDFPIGIALLSRSIISKRVNSSFGIKYLVYIYFLGERTREDFLEVLKKRRTPGAAKFVRDLRKVFEKVRAGSAAG